MLEVILHDEPSEEFKAAIRFYESREAGLGELFLQRVSDGFDFVRDHPQAGQITFDEIRRHIIQQFPYSIVYRVEHEVIFVPTGVVDLDTGKEESIDARSHHQFFRRRRRSRNS